MQFDNLQPLQTHQVDGARLFANRFDQIMFIRQEMLAAGLTNPSILEIGVGFGVFSKFMIQALTPKTFAGIDVFQFHTYETLWGINVEEMLQGRQHVDYYRDELSAMFDGELLIEMGDSAEAIGRFADDSFDLIYVDAGHTYQEVIVDARASLPKLRRGGYIIFNDYTMTDHLSRVDYGVVKAANELINEDPSMKVVSFALEPQMFCDLAVKVG